MALVIKDRIKEGTTTTGTGAISPAGAAATFDTFSSVMSDGDTTYYAIVHTTSNTDEWEVGLGTWNTGNTITRTTVISSSNSNNAVNFSAGTKDLFMTMPADKTLIEDANNDVVVGRNLTVTGTLQVDGTTTTVNSATVTVDDPIFTLGGDVAPSSDDNKDRGIEFRYHTGSAAKVGFFGFDDSAGKFTFIPDATNSSEVFSGTAGTIVAALEGNATTATTLATARNIAGQSFDGSAAINIGPTDLTGVTATASELNILDGVTATATELNLIDGVTATTAELNYVDGVTSNVQTQIDTKQPYHTIAVTVVNSGGNKYALDGTVQQTALLPKSVTIRFDQSDSSNSSHPLLLSTVSDGTHNSGSAFTTGVSTVGTPGSAGAYTQVTLEQDAPDLLYTYCTNHSGMGAKVYSGKDFSTLTSTIAELNILDGVTSTAAELNILDGVTSTAAELNILDGVTATAAELNILDGVTATTTELNLIDGVTATTAELNYVDGVTSNVQTQLDAKLPLAGGTMTGGLRQDVDTVAGGGSTVTIDLAASNNFKVNMTANTTFAFSNKDAGRFGNIVFVQDGTGGRSFTLPSECKTPVNGATIVQSTGANEISVLGYFVLDSSNILVNYIGDFA